VPAILAFRQTMSSVILIHSALCGYFIDEFNFYFGRPKSRVFASYRVLSIISVLQ